MNVTEQFDEAMKSENITNTGAFLAGETDCIKGNQHQRGCHPDYDRGYAARYELEKLMTARSE